MFTATGWEIWLLGAMLHYKILFSLFYITQTHQSGQSLRDVVQLPPGEYFDAVLLGPARYNAQHVAAQHSQSRLGTGLEKLVNKG